MQEFLKVDYMQPFLEKAIELEALKFGDFTLKSGLKSSYFFDISEFFKNDALKMLADLYVKKILEEKISFDAIFGPAYKGIPLASAVGISFFEKTGKIIDLVFDRKETKDHGEGGNIIGNLNQKKVLIIDDVLTAGTAIKNSLEVLKNQNASLAGVIVALDREEKNESGITYKNLLEINGIKIFSIANISDLNI
ncbi:MAG: orotate phosphoribosyltransferase [Flavobacteriaceae bacterium]|jgi:orotate phosphoribosyltransferase|nr:orotate phosphoribosyltransferase [Flavobacteriaceae bacterium]|tara:strand:+ start:31012 stop:31593 length:582 start_codon:yes stop_codon:yes gene_type:complete